MFQFLIGSLKTIYIEYPIEVSKMFQFLIGSLKTIILLNFAFINSFRFQFLIGSLKTKASKPLDGLLGSGFNSL